MDSIVAWFNAWWWVVLTVAMVLIKVLNLVTKHFSEYRGLVKWCLFLVDILDVLKSTPPPAVPK